MGGKCLDHYAMPAPPKKIMTSRVVKNIEGSRKDGKSNRRFSNFYFSNACIPVVELHMFTEDSEMCWLPTYFDNPGVLRENKESLLLMSETTF